jgi:hypothetical protein
VLTPEAPDREATPASKAASARAALSEPW